MIVVTAFNQINSTEPFPVQTGGNSRIYKRCIRGSSRRNIRTIIWLNKTQFLTCQRGTSLWTTFRLSLQLDTWDSSAFFKSFISDWSSHPRFSTFFSITSLWKSFLKSKPSFLDLLRMSTCGIIMHYTTGTRPFPQIWLSLKLAPTFSFSNLL